ncbi:MAG: hypothetical protein KF859_11845 [Phycisphaeraceae bacterium]|nr:hypothetical protein [Phycisphaeraceae bacterium]
MRTACFIPGAFFLLLCGSGCTGSDVGEPAPHVPLPIVGLPCEGCEGVFQGLPGELTSHARIAPEGEHGQPLRIEGVVTNERGRPARGIIVYAYHTDAAGRYPPHPDFRSGAAADHGRLRAWAITDSAGRYRFDTVMPAPYPQHDTPRHVHMHIIEPGRCTYYIDDLLFADDPLLTPSRRAALVGGRGGDGAVVEPLRDESGTLIATRNIRLGAGISGYPPRPEPPAPQRPEPAPNP